MNERDKQTYQLYGRKSYEEPLAYVGTVRELRDIDRSRWVELVAVPETAVIQVIPWPVIPWPAIPGEEKDE
jgi:hypothetical protein